MSELDMITKAIKKFDKVMEDSGVKDRYSEIVGTVPEDEIIYLTGMSINKRTFHTIYELMLNDKDFSQALNVFKNDIEAINVGIADYGKEGKKGFERLKQEIATNVSHGMANTFAFIPLGISLGVDTSFIFFNVAVAVASCLKCYFNIKPEQIDESVLGTEILSELYENKDSILAELQKLKVNDFFAIFQSNQSDSRGVTSLASGHSKSFALNYGYADKPFYENIFINNLSLKVNNKNLISDNDLQKIYETCYQQHILDVIGARILKDKVFDIAEKTYKGNIREVISKEAQKSVTDALANRNLFGIDLVSRFLYSLIENIKFKLAEKEIAFQKIKVYASKRGRITDFTKELFEYGSCPSSFVLVDDKNEADIIIDCQCLDNNRLQPSSVEIEQGKVIIPIKYFVSLPIIIDEKDGSQIPTREIYVPERLVHRADDNYSMNVYTVGGIEHNRPLMRLVNIHRQQQKNQRQLGYFDNHFDLNHKFKYLKDAKYEHYFLMGANQLVSGLNGFHYEREDDYTGNSISPDAKLIYFNLIEENSKFVNSDKPLTWHIVSVYGFSALASAYATLSTIINIKESLEYPEDYLTFDTKEKQYTNSLAFKALHISERDYIKDNMSVITRRLQFQPTQFMERNLKEICEKLEPFAYLRLEYLKPEADRKLIHFMQGTGEFVSDSSKAIINAPLGSNSSRMETKK